MTSEFLHNHLETLARRAKLATAITALSIVETEESPARADFSAQLDELDRVISENEQKIQSYSDTIDDPIARTAFILRYIYGMTWQQVATATNNNSDSIRKIVYTYTPPQK